MGRYVIEYDPIILIIITRPDKPGRSVYLRSEPDQQAIADLLTKGEMERLVSGGSTVEVEDDEPRAAIIARLWATDATRLEVKKGKRGCGKRFVEIGVGIPIAAIFLAMSIDPASGTFFDRVLFSACIILPVFLLLPAWLVGWVIFKLLEVILHIKIFGAENG